MSNHDKNKEKDDDVKDHDTALFRQFCQSVKPLKKDNRITLKPDRSKKNTTFSEKAYYNRPLELPYEINRKTEAAKTIYGHQRTNRKIGISGYVSGRIN